MTDAAPATSGVSIEATSRRARLGVRRRGLADLLLEWSPALLFAYAIGLTALASDTLEHSLGLPQLRFQRLWFVMIPAAAILVARFRGRKISIPYLREFLILIAVALLLEAPLARSAGHVSDYRFVERMAWVYGFFLLFVNYGVDRARVARVIRDALVLIGAYCCISLLGYLGIIRTAATTYDLLADVTGLRMYSEINVSWIGYVAVMGIFLVTARRYMQSRGGVSDVVGDSIYIGLMGLMVFLTASRGATAIALGLVLAYFPVLWISSGREIRLIALATACILAALTLPHLNAEFAERIYVVQRFTQSDFASTSRGIQITASWDNFKAHPFIGVGFANAASGWRQNITRSNFQYTQLLATGGIPLLLVFLAFYGRMYAGGLAFLQHPIIALSGFMAFAELVADRAPPFFAIAAYVVLYFIVAANPQNGRLRATNSQ